jgi:predicted enzyme related to lactoylglutathione lyase
MNDRGMTQSDPHPEVLRLIVSVEHLERALPLYRDVLGLELTRRHGELAWLATNDGLEIMLHERATIASENALSIGFVVDDLDAVVAGWAERGGRVIDPPELQPWGERMAVVTDADGHVVCISGRAT